MTIWTKTLLKAHGWEPLEKEKPKVFPKSPSLFTITRWTPEMRIISNWSQVSIFGRRRHSLLLVPCSGRWATSSRIFRRLDRTKRGRLQLRIQNWKSLWTQRLKMRWSTLPCRPFSPQKLSLDLRWTVNNIKSRGLYNLTEEDNSGTYSFAFWNVFLFMLYIYNKVNTEQSVERPWEPTGITIQVDPTLYSGYVHLMGSKK